MKSVRYSLIYRFFASQIEFGYYQNGDILPTVEQLQKAYHAASKTVRNAYLQLQEDGYISVSAGRRTVVVYDSTPEECRRNRQRYYLARRDAILAMNTALSPIVVPLLREGCRRLDRQDMRRIKELAAELEAGNFYFSFYCGRAMILALKNHLALGLFNELVSFYQFPHTMLQREPAAERSKQFQELSSQTVAACDSGDPHQLCGAYLRLQSFLYDTIMEYIEQGERELPPQEQIPFVWRVYQDRPQVCYSVSAELIGQIYNDRKYEAGGFLPPYKAMNQAFDVSYITIRRVVELLEQFGVVRAIHGVGTQVVELTPDTVRHQMQSPTVRKLLVRAQEAMQLICITLGDVVGHFFPQPDDMLQRCAAALEVPQGGQPSFQAYFICLEFLMYTSSNPYLKDIWEKLYHITLLGLPTLKARTAESDIAARLTACVEGLLPPLRQGDAQAFQKELFGLAELASNTIREALMMAEDTEQE